MLKKAMMGVLALFLFMSFTGEQQAHANEASPETRATWLWNPWMFVKDEAGTLAFLESKNLNKVYVQIDPDVTKDFYRSFIEKAKAKGMEVYALDGAPSWAAPTGYTQQDALMNWLTDYQNTTGQNARFAGIHLDVEPYLYSGWNTNRAATIKSYQALLQRAGAGAKKLALPLEADMPFWFDEISYKNTYGKGLLAEWVIANTDGVAIMAYRDSAPMIIDVVKTEMAMAQKYGKKIVIGVETDVTDEGSIITFSEEGEAYMNEQLALVTAHFAGHPALGGVAIHHVDSWKTLRP